MSSTAGSNTACSSPGSPPCTPVAAEGCKNEAWVKVPAHRHLVDDLHQTFSVAEELEGAVVLLTGATGYVGSLMLELILRVCPRVRKVYLLIRNKKGVQAEQRLNELLSGPIFHYHNPADIKPKLEVLNADMTEPQCGLSDTECNSVTREANYVIHCAAAIRFDMHIQEILGQTFTPTENLLKLASRTPGMRCFCFMSTAFVNANLPKGTCVQERIYPLRGTSYADGSSLARRLLQLPPELAEAEAQELMEDNGLQNTYFLAKNLTERAVAAADGQPHRICIIRPSIIGSVARAPYPGFIGNSSGFTAALLGAAAGIVAFAQHSPNSVVTIVPGDIVAATTLLATAAHGRAAALQHPPPCSTIVHACTSSTHPVTSERLHLLCCNYLNEDPPQSGTLCSTFHVDWVEGPLAFWWRCIRHALMVSLMAAFLRFRGQAKLARRLSMAWERWRELASKKFDFNLTFQTSAAQALEKMLCAQEQGPLKVSWQREGGDSWLRYLRTYVAGVKHLYRNEAPTVYDVQDYRPRS